MRLFCATKHAEAIKDCCGRGRDAVVVVEGGGGMIVMTFNRVHPPWLLVTSLPMREGMWGRVRITMGITFTYTHRAQSMFTFYYRKVAEVR